MCAGLFGGIALAETEFTYSVGAMQRSYSDDTTLAFAASQAPRLSSEETETIGQSLEVQFLSDRVWGRGFFYDEDFTTNIAVTDFGGLFVAVTPGGIGFFGDLTLEFERDTNLTRFDVLHEVAQFRGVTVYAGPSFVQFSDSMQFDLTNSVATADFGFTGSSTLAGAAVGARYDIAPPQGSNGFNLSAHGTIGLYHASHSANYSTAGSAVTSIPPAINASSTSATGAADLGLTVGYTMSETSEISLTYNVGYYGEFVDTAAFVQSTDAFGGTTSFTTDAVIFQGLSLSYNLRF